uniref:Uncharacterized protein n=1 Tax=Solanum tuberosum TaxID=4113 RepID=M1A3I9_SOLTU
MKFSKNQVNHRQNENLSKSVGSWVSLAQSFIVIGTLKLTGSVLEVVWWSCSRHEWLARV